VRVQNADVQPRTIKLTASDGDCPTGTIGGVPDFGSGQDSIAVPAGATRVARVPLTIRSSDFTSFNRKSPQRCSLSFSASVGGSIDPTPANNVAPLELSVIDRNDPEQTQRHESYVVSLRPLRVTIGRGHGAVTRKRRVSVGNADIGETGGHNVSVTVSDGDCPAGAVGMADFNRSLGGSQSTVTVLGGRRKRGSVPLTIDPAVFASTGVKSPARCTAEVTVTGPAGDGDASNNVSRLVIDVVDRNDF